MHGNAPKSILTGVGGWETANEQHRLFELAQGLPDGSTIVEIGGEFGMSASIFALAQNTNTSTHIITIDLFPDDLLQKHKENLQEAGFAGRTMPVKGDSQDMASVWPELAADSGIKDSPPLIDLLFIDGDHSYGGCKRDIESWVQYVKTGGLVVFHDSTPPSNTVPHSLHHEVQRAIEEWISKVSQGDQLWQELEYTDTMRVFRLLSVKTNEAPIKPAAKGKKTN